MSYILDALRRADSERERGAIPDIHAQPVPLLPDEEPARPRIAPWVWGASAIGAIALLAAALVWALARQESPSARGAAQPPGSPALSGPVRAEPFPPLAASPPPAVAWPNPSVPSAVTPSAAGPTPPGAQQNAAAKAGPSSTTAPRTAPSARSTQAASSAQAGVPPARAPTSPVAARHSAPAASAQRAEPGRAGASGPAGEPVPAARIYAQSELPEEIRRGVPALVVNGSVFSKNAADRFLIINGQIVHEKGAVAPDVKLEQIKLRAAVLVTRGYRFEITY